MTPAASGIALGGIAIEGPGAPVAVAVPEDPAVRVAFTRRTPDGGNLSLVVGDGDVIAQRRLALGAVTPDPDRAVFMQQVHSGDVAVVDDADAGRGLENYAGSVPSVDGLVTTSVDLPLAILAADCVPVVLVDPGRGVAAVHAGRGGVMAEVVGNAVEALAPQDPSHVVALVGPAIGGCCYEVPADMADEVAQRWPQARATTTWGTPALDLPAAVEAQLHAIGVARVERVGACTRCYADALFSHRAATAGAAPHGRQAALVVRRATSDTDVPAGSHQTPSLQSP